MAQSIVRRTIIDMALRRQRPGSGSSKRFLMKRTARVIWPDFDPILKPIPWAVTGAVATRLYMPERVTQDYDIAINPADDAAVRQRLRDAGYEYTAELKVGGSSWRKDGLKIDVVEPGDEWVAAAIAQAQSNRDGQGLPIMPLPYLVMIKLRRGSLVDMGDLGRLVGCTDESALADVRALIAHYSPEDSPELESLIYLGKLEVDNAS